MACGNNEVSRSYLSSPPKDISPLVEIHARLPNDSSRDRLKSDVWVTRSGRFEDRPGVARAHPGVDSPGEGKWDFKPNADAGNKAYTHMTGRTGWLGPASLLNQLPEVARKSLESRRVIVLGKSPNQRWVNERATTFDSMNRAQETVVRRPE